MDKSPAASQAGAKACAGNEAWKEEALRVCKSVYTF